MGIPNSEVGYNPAMPRREDHEVHKDMLWGHWTKKKLYYIYVSVNTTNTYGITLLRHVSTCDIHHQSHLRSK